MHKEYYEYIGRWYNGKITEKNK